MKNTRHLFASALITSMLSTSALADKLDDIVDNGELRCAVTLDNGQAGFRDADNQPAGFDVDYCNDLATAMGVKAVIVETPFPDRIPAIISGRADVAVASTSPTLERAKSIGFTKPYFAYNYVVLTRDDTGIKSYQDLKGHVVSTPQGNYGNDFISADIKKWNDPAGSLKSYQSMNDNILSVSQGHSAATVVVNTVAQDAVKSGKFKGLKIAAAAPWDVDYVSLAVEREEYGFINYLNMFIDQQNRTGRYKQLWDKWIGGDVLDPSHSTAMH
ncbi:transporter substrate-binding domain-containing protein [Pseudomonas sp. DCB_AW]|uniref:transporter substrate-binding domain-containing protein n=1 Tax=Pseudomonas sp. DCB_AW TaxID=2993596 RepID=UPI002248C96A|nr:transporter substrate-binding domain-containing protein [Pseudomonas sp. DCB_AW]MCX2684723.1 transporter substrate-binding domain-containing protein [Pseudomonas sp. DCB_AW]